TLIEKRVRKLKLYKAAMSGDWETAEGILDKYPEEVKTRMNTEGQTALHIGTAASHTHFVEQLINKIPDEENTSGYLNIKTYTSVRPDDEGNAATGNTAFFYAAASGNVKIAQIMLEKNKDLAMIEGRGNVLPIHIAALLGRGKMVRYLYKETKYELQATQIEDLIAFLVALINADIYDVAMKLVKAKPELAIEKDSQNETALHAFARKPCNHKHAIPSSPLMRLFSGLNIFGKKNQLQKEGLELAKFIWEKIVLLDDQRISGLMVGNSGQKLIFIAARQGNAEFLATLISSYPDLVLKVDKNKYTIFHIAVKHRHVEIFKLIYEIGSITDVINVYRDGNGNNMLHLAGMLAPASQLNVVPGAALQLQRELLWFEEVKEVVSLREMEEKNKKGDTPRDVLLKQHKGLMQQGENWLRNTANSCMLVATLIATVVFTAAFTVPGGIGPDNGIPILLNRIWFKIFAISDAISLIFSASSVLCFLSLLTSRFSIEDFRFSLPTKLVFGLFFLFVAILAMMVAFVATYFIIFKHGLHRFALPIAGIAAIPILLFFVQHVRLFVQVIGSTYMSFLLFRCRKNTLFPRRRSKFTLKLKNLLKFKK
ncbi:ankyrin repeat-containing protein At5g02620-like, partial [Hevea brasiliensis]|uniref:ankyrin repeat-containing protein At5g02620-like n=1 Tax=Hevea brasiliensis TaxID=3981 RepID=UPI0025D8AAC4